MPFANGVFALVSGVNPVVTGTTISSNWANSTLQDIATGLSTAILKDGSQTVTQNIPFSGFRLTGIGAGTATTDAARIDQLQSQSLSSLTSVTGSNTIAGAATPAPSAYALGQVFWWIQATTNTGATTLNVSALGAVNLFKNSPAGLVACVANDLIAGNNYFARYDTAGSDQFVLLNPSTPDGLITTTGLTAAGTNQATALELTANINRMGTVAVGTGVKLNSAITAGLPQIVFNGGANPLLVYPATGGAINSLPANAGMTLAPNTTCQFWATSATAWVGILSA
jgi:hypothetical protein